MNIEVVPEGVWLSGHTPVKTPDQARALGAALLAAADAAEMDLDFRPVGLDSVRPAC